MEKKKYSISRFFTKMFMLVPNLISLAFHMTELIGAESRIAVKSIILIIMLSAIFGCLLVASWLCLMGVVCVYLVSLQLSWMSSLLIIFSLNILILIFIGIYIIRVKERLFFPATRYQVRNMMQIYRDL